MKSDTDRSGAVPDQRDLCQTRSVLLWLRRFNGAHLVSISAPVRNLSANPLEGQNLVFESDVQVELLRGADRDVRRYWRRARFWCRSGESENVEPIAEVLIRSARYGWEERKVALDRHEDKGLVHALTSLEEISWVVAVLT
mgnify:CR=1 FL=1